MISICLKSLNQNDINYIEHEFDNCTLSNIYYSQKKFSKFYNLIIHFSGIEQRKFYDCFSKILSNFIINCYEDKILRQIMVFDFFYFSKDEKKGIIEKTHNYLCEKTIFNKKQKILQASIKLFFKQCTRCNLEGFINFRIPLYRSYLESVLESFISSYVVNNEYNEYIRLLRAYITEQLPQSEDIHLLYSTNSKTLLDSSKNIIANTSSETKYLSDITFSSNDFILNTLLTLLPQRLYIHTENSVDNFIEFLQQIFCERAVLC